MVTLTDITPAGRIAQALNALPAPPAVVLGGQVGGLAVARLLGRRGVPVAVVDPDEHALARASRFAVAGAAVPSPLADEQAVLTWLIELASELARPAVLFPTADEWALVVARHRDDLPPRLVPPPAGGDVVSAVLDKGRLYAAARAVGVPVPRFAVFDPATLEDAERRVRYPCVIKPAEKGDFVDRFGQAAVVCGNRAELRATIEAAGERQLLLQQLLPVEDAVLQTSALYIDRQGRLAASFGGRRLGVYPVGFGTSCLVESRPEPKLAERAFRLLSHLGYRGLAEVEFIWDPGDQDWKLIDVNPRCWKWVGLPGFAGVDLVWLAYCDATRQPAEPSEQVPGRRWASLLDLASLRAATGRALLSDRESQAALTADHHQPEIMDAVYTPDDPMPFLRALEAGARTAPITCRC